MLNCMHAVKMENKTKIHFIEQGLLNSCNMLLARVLEMLKSTVKK